MAYTKQTWVDGSGGGTPLSAARLNYIESGIEAASVGGGGSGGDPATVDGTTITTSTDLQSAVTTAAATGKAVRLKPGQLIAMSSTVTIPEGGGIVCDTIAAWRIDDAPAYRPVLKAQTGFTGPMIKVTANTYGVRLRGFEIDANGVTGVTFGLFFDLTGPAYLTNSHNIEQVGVRRVTNGTGIGGRVQTTTFQHCNVFQCLIGVQVGGAGSWYDTRWHGGFIAYCRTAGVEFAVDGSGDPPALVQFSNVRSERNGQTPYDPNNALGDPWWNNNTPGWSIWAARHCAFINCTTDANTGPGFQAIAGTGQLSKVRDNIITGCIFNRDGVGNGTSFSGSSVGVYVAGSSSAAANHIGPHLFRNCLVLTGASSDAGDSTYLSPSYGVSVDHADHFSWHGQAHGVTKGLYFGTKDLWRLQVADNYAELHFVAAAYTTTIPNTSAV